MGVENKKIVISNYYQELSDIDKKKLREDFMKDFDYSQDTFYKKMRSNRYRPMEFKWWAKKMNTAVSSIYNVSKTKKES